MDTKLKKCTIHESKEKQRSVLEDQTDKIGGVVNVDEAQKNDLIMFLSNQSDRYGDKLIDFMEVYDLINLQEATVTQLREYITTHYHVDLSPTPTNNQDHII